MEVYKFLPKVRGGAQRAEGSVVEGKLLYYCLFFREQRTEFNCRAEHSLDWYGRTVRAS